MGPLRASQMYRIMASPPRLCATRGRRRRLRLRLVASLAQRPCRVNEESRPNLPSGRMRPTCGADLSMRHSAFIPGRTAAGTQGSGRETTVRSAKQRIDDRDEPGGPLGEAQSGSASGTAKQMLVSNEIRQHNDRYGHPSNMDIQVCSPARADRRGEGS